MASVCLGHETLAVSSSSVGFASVPAGADVARIIVETAAVRYKLDGTAPTSSQGSPAEADSEVIVVSDLAKFRVVRRDSSDATLQIEYWLDG